jgi:hypothetical protein
MLVIPTKSEEERAVKSRGKKSARSGRKGSQSAKSSKKPTRKVLSERAAVRR